MHRDSTAGVVPQQWIDFAAVLRLVLLLGLRRIVFYYYSSLHSFIALSLRSSSLFKFKLAVRGWDRWAGRRA